MKSYLDNWDSIFGKRKSFRQLASMDDGINRHQRKLIKGSGTISVKKSTKAKNTRKRRRRKGQLCPHCATMNLIRKSSWETNCRRCGYEGH